MNHDESSSIRQCLIVFEQDPNETNPQAGPPGPPGKGM